MVAAFVTVCLLAVLARPADHAEGKKNDVRFLTVDPAELVDRIRTDWQPVPRGEFESLLKQRGAAGGPSPIFITSAEYHATFDGHSLQAGRFTARIDRRTSDARWLNLEKCNLTITAMRSGKQSLNWGVDQRNQVLANIPDTAREFSGEWTLRGNPDTGEVRIPVKLMPAAASRLHLRLPADWILETSAGDVQRRQPADKDGWTNWTVDISSSDSLTLHFLRETIQRPARPLILYDADAIYVVRESGLQLQYEIRLNVLHAPTRTLDLQLPEGIEVYSIRYGGDAPLRFVTRTVGEFQRIRVMLPDPLSGKSRPISVQAVSSTVPSADSVLPKLVVVNGAFLSGQTHVRVDQPLELRSYTVHGLRQVTAVARQPAGELLTFRQDAVDAELRIDVSRPKTAQQARVVSHVNVQGGRWRVISEMTWNVKSGTLFEVQCRIAPGWTVASVEIPPQDETDAGQSLSWTEEREALRQRIITIPLPLAISRKETVSLRITAQSIAPMRRRTVRLPVLTPQGVSRLLSISYLSHRAGIAPRLIENGTYERTASAALPKDITQSAVLKPLLAAAETPHMLLVSRSKNPRGIIALEQPSAPYAAHTWLSVKTIGNHLFESTYVDIQPTDQPVRSVLVSVSQPGSALTWSVASPSQEALNAAKITRPEESAAGQVFSHGELWEIRLNKPTTKRIRLVARRRLPLNREMKPALLFLPQAIRFEGIIEIDASEQQSVRTVGVYPVTDRKAVLSLRPPIGPSNAARLLMYRTPNAAVTVLDDTAVARRSRVTSLELWSTVSVGDGGGCQNRARYRLAAQSLTGRFEFSMPDSCRLQSIQLNGRVIHTLPKHGVVTIDKLPADRAHTIDIRYLTPAVASGWKRDWRVFVPQIPELVREFRWHIALPPNLRVNHRPDGMSFSPGPQDAGWSGRLLGPLAQPANALPFNPFSAAAWDNLFQTENAADQPQTDEDWAPRGWRVYSANSPGIPQTLKLSLYETRDVLHIAWILLLACLFVGLAIRRLGVPGRDRFGAVWLSLLLGLAVVVPSEYAEVIGGCIVGSLVALLIPRRLIRPEGSSDQSSPGIPVGSTASFPRVATTTTMLLMAAFALRSSIATGQQSADSKGDAKKRSSVVPRETDVLVPKTNASKDGSPVVYVHRALLQRLREQAAQNNPHPDYLIRDANYAIQTVSATSADVAATYRVLIPRESQSLSIALPMKRAHLCGGNACRVDGHVQPVRWDADRGGFQIPWKRNMRSGDESDGETESSFRVARIRLCLRVPIVRAGDDETLSFDVPAIPSGRVELSTAPDDRSVSTNLSEVNDVSGWFTRTITGSLGRQRNLTIHWSPGELVLRPKTEASTETYLLVEALPTHFVYRYHMTYKDLSTPLSEINWTFPSQWGLREVTLADGKSGRPRVQIRRSRQTEQIAHVVLPTPASSSVALIAEFVVPHDGIQQSFRLSVPSLHPTRARGKKAASFVVHNARFRVGLVASSELRFVAEPVRVDAVQQLPLEQREPFRELFSGGRVPETAYELQATTVFRAQLKLKTARRTVRQSHVFTVLKNRVVVEMTADVSVQDASTLQHVLRIPPQLDLDLVEVHEDMAPRLTRWARHGGNVILFLANETAGTQKVHVRGVLPVERSTRFLLPGIRFEDAEILSSEIQIHRSPQVGVTIADLKGCVQHPEQPPDVAASGVFPVATLTGDLSGQMPLIARTPRGQTLKADMVTTLTRTGDNVWSVDYRLHWQDSLLSRRVVVRVPANIAQNATLNGTDWSIDRRIEATGYVDWYARYRGQGDPVELSVQLNKIQPESSRWTLPAVTLPYASQIGNYLIVSEARGRHAIVSFAESIQPLALPAWSPPQHRGANHDAYRNHGGAWQIEWKPGTTEERSRIISVPFMETVIWESELSKSRGRTDIWAHAEEGSTLDIQLPDSLNARSVLLNGVSIGESPDALRQLSIRLPGPGLHFVRIYWSPRTPRRFPAIARRQFQLPKPEGIVVGENLLHVSVPAQRVVFRESGVQSLTQLAFQLDRIEHLLKLAKRNRSSAASMRFAFRSAAESLDQITRQIHQGPNNRAGLTESDRERITRLQRLRTEIGNAIPEPSGATDHPLDVMPMAAPQFLATDWHGRIETADSQQAQSVFYVNKTLLRFVVGLVVFLIAMLITRQLFRLEVGNLLARWEAVSWAFLGLFWWLFLTPAFLGIVFLAIAAYKAVRKLLQSGEEENVIRLFDRSESTSRKSHPST